MITVRFNNSPQALADFIELAKRKNISLNQYVVDLVIKELVANEVTNQGPTNEVA